MIRALACVLALAGCSRTSSKPEAPPDAATASSIAHVSASAVPVIASAVAFDGSHSLVQSAPWSIRLPGRFHEEPDENALQYENQESQAELFVSHLPAKQPLTREMVDEVVSTLVRSRREQLEALGEGKVTFGADEPMTIAAVRCPVLSGENTKQGVRFYVAVIGRTGHVTTFSFYQPIAKVSAEAFRAWVETALRSVTLSPP